MKSQNSHNCDLTVGFTGLYLMSKKKKKHYITQKTKAVHEKPINIKESILYLFAIMINLNDVVDK